MTMFKTLVLISVVAAAATGCGSPPTVTSIDSSPTPAQIQTATKGIDAAYRALPSRVGSVSQPAHYQHVFTAERETNARSLQTIELKDAVKSGVLASSELEVKKLAKLDPNKMQWTTFESGFNTPNAIEAVAGADVQQVNVAEVNFALNETVILDPEPLLALTRMAGRVSGLFYVAGYTDVSGAEAKNMKLSKDRAKSVAEALTAAGVNATRITAVGAGISFRYPELSPNRRATITFKVLDDSK